MISPQKALFFLRHRRYIGGNKSIALIIQTAQSVKSISDLNANNAQHYFFKPHRGIGSNRHFNFHHQEELHRKYISHIEGNTRFAQRDFNL